MDIQRSGERFAEVGGLTLCYESFGDPTDETVLLVMGLGLSMLYWREEVCVELARWVWPELAGLERTAKRTPHRP